MQKLFLLLMTSTSILFFEPAYPSEFNAESIPVIVEITQNNNHPNGTPREKEVYLTSVKLSNEEKQKLLSYQDISSENVSMNLPSHVDLGMNNVPVLDQGRHGTCVTFSNSAAIDALLKKGDYISQLCNLELGDYLQKNGYLRSGWKGLTGPQFLDQVTRFGIINKDNQHTKSCAGVTEYPVNQPENKGTPMSLQDFKQLSETIQDQIYWKPILDTWSRLNNDPVNPAYNGNATLLTVKRHLAMSNTGHIKDRRLTFGVYLTKGYCKAGACGSYHNKYDTWVLTKSISDDKAPLLAGHQMIIFGYDDNAVVMDNEGGKHKGTLLLRNSWGDDVGDHGNYYMTYDYFKKFVHEIQVIELIDTST
jgi:hypothetical protein